jgi:SAM-dependent MidA family methyltransferase
MFDALYGENGFYLMGGAAGRREGDFLTSPEVGPLFGEIVANVIDETWIELGRPEKFDFVECGAGPGTLARSILAAKPQCLDSLNYVAVEISDSQRKLHPLDVVSVKEMPSGPFNGIIFANELLDNIPFRLFVFDEMWKEAFVVNEGHGRFSEVLKLSDDNFSFLPANASHGTRVPIQTQAGRWVQLAHERLSSGKMILIDYCTESTSEICSIPWRNWLRTYKNHERGSHYLNEPGSQDITSQVVLDQLRMYVPNLQVESQSNWLKKYRIEDLVGVGKRYWEEHRSNPNVLALKMLSRVNEASILMDEIGLGGYMVLTINSGSESCQPM